DGDARLRGLLQRVAERRDVGVEARAHVLYVVDERVEVLQLLGLRSSRLAVERVDGQARLLVNRVRNFLVRLTSYAVLRREERRELHALRFAQNVNRLSARAVAPSVIRNQPDAHALKLL